MSPVVQQVKRRHVQGALIAMTLLLVSCAEANGDQVMTEVASQPAEVVAAEPAPTSIETQPSPTIPPAPTAEPTSPPQPTATPEPTATALPTATPAPTPTPTPLPESALPPADCVRLVDFVRGGVADLWRVVNDGVMGGRSFGQATVGDSVVMFDGIIDTNGGGFSSIRGPVQLGAMQGADRLRMRVRSDGRSYEVITDDAAPGRDRRVSYFAPIVIDGDDWVEVDVDLSTLEARIFGTPVTTEPFDPDLAVAIGIILADGIDGEFRLDIDWIDACVGPTRV